MGEGREAIGTGTNELVLVLGEEVMFCLLLQHIHGREQLFAVMNVS